VRDIQLREKCSRWTRARLDPESRAAALPPALAVGPPVEEAAPPPFPPSGNND
jgi:hypothetical protein